MKKLFVGLCSFFCVTCSFATELTDWSKFVYREILAGVPVVWTGDELIGIQEVKITAPDWFVEPLPSYAIKAVLQRKQELNATFLVEEKAIDWGEIRLVLLDLPESKDIFSSRYANLKKLTQKLNQGYIQLVKYFPVKNERHLLSVLENQENTDNKGIVIESLDATYQKNKQDEILRLTKWQDDKAFVIEHKRNETKLRTSALVVQTANGKIFQIKLNLNNKNPPKIGSQIVYSYNGFTKNELPRFAKFKSVLDKDQTRQIHNYLNDE